MAPVLAIPCHGSRQCSKEVPSLFTAALISPTRRRVVKWVASKGNHIVLTATSFGGCCHCLNLPKPEVDRKHRHFPCPYWS